MPAPSPCRAGPVRRTLGFAVPGSAILAALGIAFLPGLPRNTRALAGDGDCCGGGDAAAPAKAEGEAKAEGLLLDLGNAKCPIMGGKPDGKTYSEWSGLRVGHCCPGCGGKFLADPARALDKAGIDWKDAAAAVKKVEAAAGADREKLLAAAAKRWKVIRAPATPKAVLDLGNAKCPIMGGRPDGKSFSEWNGLRVGHCCPMCEEKFKADPEAALKKAGIEWKDAAAAVKKVNESEGEARAKALAELGKKWKLVETAPAEKSGK